MLFYAQVSLFEVDLDRFRQDVSTQTEYRSRSP